MLTPSVAGALANTGLGLIYSQIAPKFALLNHVGMKTQVKAFLVSAAIQGVITHQMDASEQQTDAQKVVRIYLPYLPYLLIAGVTCYFHEISYKANLVSTAILGTVQLSVSKLAEIIFVPEITEPTEPFYRHGDPRVDNAILPYDWLVYVFEYLDKTDTASSARVSRSWYEATCHPSIQKKLLEQFVFGPKDWKAYFGDVGIAPSVPENILDILKAGCPYWKYKRIRETHMLVLIPKSVDGEPLTLNTLKTLIKNPKKGENATAYSSESTGVLGELGDEEVKESYWALITKDVIPESRYKTYNDQQKLLKDGDITPKVLEMAIGILTHYVKNEKSLYTDDTPTYTRCQERPHHLATRVVGCFSKSKGLVLSTYRDRIQLNKRFDQYRFGEHHGLTAVRKLNRGA